MSIIFVLVGISLALAASFLGAFVWATRNGQFRDCATPAMRMLHDTTLRRLSNTKANTTDEDPQDD